MNALLFALAALLLVACGGDAATDEDALEAAGIPTESSTFKCGGDVVISHGGDGSINARGGDCALAEAEEEEDESDFLPPDGELPRFLTPSPS